VINYVDSTGCNNERQPFAKLSYCAIDNVLTNLLRFAGLLSGAQRLECDKDGKQSVKSAPQIEKSTGFKHDLLSSALHNF